MTIMLANFVVPNIGTPTLAIRVESLIINRFGDYVVS